MRALTCPTSCLSMPLTLILHVVGDRHRDALGHRVFHRVRIAHVHRQLPAGDAGLEAHALDLQFAAVAVLDARQPCSAAAPGSCRGPRGSACRRPGGRRQHGAVEGHGHGGGDLQRQFALGALQGPTPSATAAVTPAGSVTGNLPILDMVFASGYQTWQSTSPPTLAARASRSVIRPRLVLSTAVPMPPRTRGIAVAAT
jgi:hypothetical protein